MASRCGLAREAGTRPVVSALRLIAAQREMAVLRRLAQGPVGMEGLASELAQVERTTRYDVVKRLVECVAARPVVEAGRQRWEVTPHGRRLLQIERFATALARRLPPAPGVSLDRWCALVLDRLADPRLVLVLRTLCVCGPARPSEIERALAGRVTHRGVHERLKELVAGGIVERYLEGRRVRYALRDRWAAFGCLLLLAADWEWTVGEPAHPEIGSDLSGLVTLVAPLVRAPSRRAGTCMVVVDDDRALDRGAWVRLQGGRLLVVAIESAGHVDGPLRGRGASGRGSRCGAHARVVTSPAHWTAALLGDENAAFDVSGDPALAADVVRCLAAGIVGALSSMRRDSA